MGAKNSEGRHKKVGNIKSGKLAAEGMRNATGGLSGKKRRKKDHRDQGERRLQTQQNRK